jgi:hypothetical protein
MKSRRIALTFTLAIAAIAIWLPVNHVAAADQVPFKGTFVFSFSLVPVSQTVLHVTADGVGRTAHLGKTTFHSESDIDVLTGIETGSVFYTAANGDTVSATFVGLATPPDAQGMSELAGTDTFTGGTGRFSGANGSADFTAITQNTGPTAGIGQLTIKGTVSSPGSN